MDKNNNPDINENPDIKMEEDKKDLYASKSVNTDKKPVENPLDKDFENKKVISNEVSDDKITGHSLLEDSEDKYAVAYEKDPKNNEKIESYNKRVEKSASMRPDNIDKKTYSSAVKNDAKKVDLYSEDKANREHDRNKNNYHTNPNYIYDEDGKDYYPKAFYAGFWKRFIAFMIDSIIASFLSKILVDGAYAIGGFQTEDKIYTIATTIVFLLYFFIMTLVTNGQTLGKMIMRLRVVRIDGEKLDFMTTLTREVAGRYIHTIGILSLLYIITAFTERKQNLSDMFADTSVIDLSKQETYVIGMEDNIGYREKFVESAI